MDDKLPKSQLSDTSVSLPAAVPGAKEAEKIAMIKKELGEITEVEPGVERVEVEEIPLPEEAPKLPPELEELGVKPVVPPEVPEEFKPKAQVVTLPATKTQVHAGSTQPVVTSIRWWATLVIRLLQKTGGGFKYVLQKLGGKKE